MENMTKLTILLTFIILILSDLLSAKGTNDSLNCKSYLDSISGSEYYILVDSMPVYPGGQSEMINFFMTNFNYPSEIDTCCKVIVEFIVDTNGEVINLKIAHGLADEFDNETLRVMRMMPKWKPGKCNGKAVPVRIVIPWDMRLQ